MTKYKKTEEDDGKYDAEDVDGNIEIKREVRTGRRRIGMKMIDDNETSENLWDRLRRGAKEAESSRLDKSRQKRKRKENVDSERETKRVRSKRLPKDDTSINFKSNKTKIKGIKNYFASRPNVTPSDTGTEGKREDDRPAEASGNKTSTKD